MEWKLSPSIYLWKNNAIDDFQTERESRGTIRKYTKDMPCKWGLVDGGRDFRIRILIKCVKINGRDCDFVWLNFVYICISFKLRPCKFTINDHLKISWWRISWWRISWFKSYGRNNTINNRFCPHQSLWNGSAVERCSERNIWVSLLETNWNYRQNGTEVEVS